MVLTGDIQIKKTGPEWPVFLCLKIEQRGVSVGMQNPAIQKTPHLRLSTTPLFPPS
jgi:hypothetical protein